MRRATTKWLGRDFDLETLCSQKIRRRFKAVAEKTFLDTAKVEEDGTPLRQLRRRWREMCGK